MSMSKKDLTKHYHPRNDWVLIRIVDIDMTESGIVIPQVSEEGKQFHVISFGPKVENLAVGDIVLLSGLRDVHYFEVPGVQNLMLIQQGLVVAVVGNVKTLTE